MDDEDRSRQLAALLKETGEAHHQAFIETNGEDPEWAIWYADYLHDRLQPFLAAPMTRSQLVSCLVRAEEDHRTREPGTAWPDFYARHLLECLGPAEEPKRDHLALYHFPGCGYCHRVRAVIDELGIDVELRDIFQNRDFLKELLETRGRRTVPVLRITGGDGEERWMPESADIIRYLRATYRETVA